MKTNTGFNISRVEPCSVSVLLACILCAQHKDNIMHCYQYPDKSELPPSSWFGASVSAVHISTHSVWHSMDESTATVIFSFSLLLIWRGHFNSMLLCIFWLSCLSSLAYITPVLWIGTLPALDMVNWTFYGLWKGVFFIFHFYSWALSLAVNAFKTDSALLDSWIKTMAPIMATGCGWWPVKKAWGCWFWDLSAVSVPGVTHRHNISEAAVCAHDISPACTEYLVVTTSRGLWAFHLSPLTLHLNVIVTVVCLCTDFLCCCVFSCVLLSSSIWLCLSPGESPLLG